MSNQEPQNQEKTAEEPALEKRRRFIKGAGVAAPVVLTLSSPSVFGALCTSEIMSGNDSQHTGGGSCAKGYPPSYWKTQTSFPFPYNIASPASRFDDSNAFNTNSANGQAKIHDKMKDILDNSTSAAFPYYIWVTALLNSVSVANYPFDRGDIINLWKTNQPGLPNNDAGKNALLISTWS